MLPIVLLLKQDSLCVFDFMDRKQNFSLHSCLCIFTWKTACITSSDFTRSWTAEQGDTSWRLVISKSCLHCMFQLHTFHLFALWLCLCIWCIEFRYARTNINVAVLPVLAEVSPVTEHVAYEVKAGFERLNCEVPHACCCSQDWEKRLLLTWGWVQSRSAAQHVQPCTSSISLWNRSWRN